MAECSCCKVKERNVRLTVAACRDLIERAANAMSKIWQRKTVTAWLDFTALYITPMLVDSKKAYTSVRTL